MSDVLEARQKTEPTEVVVPILDLTWSFDGLDVSSSKEMTDVLSSLNFVLHEYRNVTKKRKFVFLVNHRTYVAERVDVSFGRVEIYPGSIIVLLSVSTTLLVSLYNGIANYPNFKQGMVLLREDITKAFERQKTSFQNSYKKRNTIESVKGSSGSIETVPVSEAEILRILEDAIKEDDPG